MGEDERELCLADSIAAGPPCAGTALTRLRAELLTIRRRGYATSAGERVPGSRSVAAPVWTLRGDLLALVTSGPATRFTEVAVAQAIPVVVGTAQRLTRQLGGGEFAADPAVREVS
jgi:DNA-binding IclR family transcriptional regulator